MVKDDVLICSPKWLGDSILAMPALQALKERSPYSRITLLAKEHLIPLWRMHPDVDALIPIKKAVWGVWEAARTIKVGCFDKAFILPNSIRATILPFLEKIPIRSGLKGCFLDSLFNKAVRSKSLPDRAHQTYRYMDILGLDTEKKMALPRLLLPQEAVANCWHLLYHLGWIFDDFHCRDRGGLHLVGLIPGAGQNLDEQWPADHFITLGKKLVNEKHCRIVVLGNRSEIPLCSKIAKKIGHNALNLAGKTTLPELAAMLSLCQAIVANDSGGMHLAAAVGTRVVAVFGTADPAEKGPIGKGHHVLQAEGSSSICCLRRKRLKARASLSRISPERVYQAVLDLNPDVSTLPSGTI